MREKTVSCQVYKSGLDRLLFILETLTFQKTLSRINGNIFPRALDTVRVLTEKKRSGSILVANTLSGGEYAFTK